MYVFIFQGCWDDDDDDDNYCDFYYFLRGLFVIWVFVREYGLGQNVIVILKFLRGQRQEKKDEGGRYKRIIFVVFIVGFRRVGIEVDVSLMDVVVKFMFFILIKQLWFGINKIEISGV